MKKIAVFLLFFTSINAFSQVGIGIGTGGVGVGMSFPINNRRQKAQNMENKVQQMRTDLNLDSSQVIRVRGLLVERERKQHKGMPMPREEFNKRMDEILTPEQKDKFKELRKQKRSDRQQAQPQQTPKDSSSTKQPASDTEWDDVYK